MNRSVVSAAHLPARQITVGTPEHGEQVKRWTARLLAKEPVVRDGQVFEWMRDGKTMTNTAYLFDAVMCNVQYAQHQLQLASAATGKRAYTCAIQAARSYAVVLNDLMPRWSFRPSDTTTLPDALESDVYAHYCLARAMAYNAVGTADLECNPRVHLAAAGNAAHLYAVAAQMIGGDVDGMVNTAQTNAADALCIHGKRCLKAWEDDEDTKGAATALACFEEAHTRYISANHAGCESDVHYANERNQVCWLRPELPEFRTMVKTRVTALQKE